MNWLKGIFSAPEIVSKTTDAIINSGDALFFTDEEKSRANVQKLEWLLKFHEASKGSNLARRWIAMSITIMFLLITFAVVICTLIGFDSQVENLLKLLSDIFIMPMSLIFAFYFGNGVIRDWRK